MDEPEPKADRAALFREEALRYHLGESEEGELLRLSPSWTRYTYWLLVSVVVVALVYLSFGRAPVYEAGPAVFQVDGRTRLASPAAGAVDAVEVLPGETVEAGQLLVRLDDARELADLGKNRQEWKSHMLELLRDPGNEVAGDHVRRLRAEQELLEARLQERRIRAPRAGVVSDVRIRQGQYLEQGGPVLHLVPAEARYRVVMLLPGQARPQLEPEMQVSLEIVGYPYTYVPATIEMVGNQVIGPSEVRRFLGAEIADGIALSGSVVVVEGKLASNSFRVGGKEYGLHDGMLARARVRLRSERLILRLIPGLRAFSRDGDV